MQVPDPGWRWLPSGKAGTAGALLGERGLSIVCVRGRGGAAWRRPGCGRVPEG